MLFLGPTSFHRGYCDHEILWGRSVGHFTFPSSTFSFPSAPLFRFNPSFLPALLRSTVSSFTPPASLLGPWMTLPTQWDLLAIQRRFFHYSCLDFRKLRLELMLFRGNSSLNARGSAVSKDWRWMALNVMWCWCWWIITIWKWSCWQRGKETRSSHGKIWNPEAATLLAISTSFSLSFERQLMKAINFLTKAIRVETASDDLQIQMFSPPWIMRVSPELCRKSKFDCILLSCIAPCTVR